MLKLLLTLQLLAMLSSSFHCKELMSMINELDSSDGAEELEHAYHSRSLEKRKPTHINGIFYDDNNYGFRSLVSASLFIGFSSVIWLYLRCFFKENMRHK